MKPLGPQAEKESIRHRKVYRNWTSCCHRFSKKDNLLPTSTHLMLMRLPVPEEPYILTSVSYTHLFKTHTTKDTVLRDKISILFKSSDVSSQNFSEAFSPRKLFTE